MSQAGSIFWSGWKVSTKVCSLYAYIYSKKLEYFPLCEGSCESLGILRKCRF